MVARVLTAREALARRTPGRMPGDESEFPAGDEDDAGCSPGVACGRAAVRRGNGGHADPAHALRQAQLWMLDPDREVPDSWPRMLRQEADIDGEPYGPDLTSIEAWAGFAYQGR